MQTIIDFITERLKLNKDTKIVSNYVLIIYPYNQNHELIKELYNDTDYRYTKIQCADVKGGSLYIIKDIDFFNDKIANKYQFKSSMTFDMILKIPIDELDDVLENFNTDTDILLNLKRKYENVTGKI